MFFLLRTAFWLSIVIALIPVNPADLHDGQRPVSTLETISIARAVVTDAAGFCERNVAACASGRELIAQFGAKAKNGWKFASTLFSGSDSAAGNLRADQDRLHTGSIRR